MSHPVLRRPRRWLTRLRDARDHALDVIIPRRVHLPPTGPRTPKQYRAMIRRDRRLQRSKSYREARRRLRQWWNNVNIDVGHIAVAAVIVAVLLFALADFAQPFTRALHYLWLALVAAAFAFTAWLYGAWLQRRDERARIIEHQLASRDAGYSGPMTDDDAVP